MARNGVIGKDGRLPWRVAEDLKRFKALTMGHPIVMGRKTWESIGRPLPGRICVVVTRRRDYAAPGAVVAHSLDEALERCAPHAEVFVIGGAEIYREALPIAQRIYLTEILADYEGDAFFPPLDRSQWRELSRERLAPEPGAPAAELVVLERLSKD
jgi:dihydrofolate reductase